MIYPYESVGWDDFVTVFVPVDARDLLFLLIHSSYDLLLFVDGQKQRYTHVGAYLYFFQKEERIKKSGEKKPLG
jgi:hypothetical protein